MDAHPSVTGVAQDTEKHTPSNLPTASEYVKEYVHRELDHYLRGRIERAKTISPRYEMMWTSMSRVIMGGGKRMRPYLFVLAYEMFGGKTNDSILRASMGIEMLHQATLIHDDVFDRDYIRHGIPNIASEFYDDYEKTHDLSMEDAIHLANSTAVLAGDMAIASAYDIVRKSGLSADSILLLEELLDNALFDVAGGELIDNETVGNDMTKTDTENIVRYKTASLSFVTPLLSGGLLANASDERIDALKDFGDNLGIAFQYADDILGVFGDELITGKSSLSDLEEGKHTFMAQYAFQHAADVQLATLHDLFGKKNMSHVEADALRELFMQTGAKQACEANVAHHAERAFSTIELLDVPEAYKEALRHIITKATKRKY